MLGGEKNMIYYFEHRETRITGQIFIEEKEKVALEDIADINQLQELDYEKLLKTYYTCADEIFNRREVKAETLSSAFNRLQGHIQSFEQHIDKIDSNLYYLTYGNVWMRKAQMESEIYGFNIASYNRARSYFKKIQPKKDFISYLARYNEIRCKRDIERYYFRYHGDRYFVFKAIDEYKELLKEILPGAECSNFLQYDEYSTDLDTLKYSICINIGRCFQNRNDFIEAKKQYEMILKSKNIWMNQEWKQRWEKLINSTIYSDVNDYDSFEINDISTCLNFNKRSHLLQTLVNLLICEIEICGKNGKAEEIANFILSIDYNNIDAHNNLGVIFRKKGQYTQAIEKFNHVLNLLHHDTDYCNNDKEGIDLQNGSIDISADKVCSKDRFALIGIAKSLIKQKKYIRAKDEIEKIKKYYPRDKEILLWEAMWYRDQKNFEKAILILENIIKDCQAIGPGTIGLKANYVMGTCYLGWGYPSQAKKCFERIQKALRYREVKDVLSQIDLGWSKQVLGEEKDAIEQYGEINRDSLEKATRVAILNNTGECYLYQKYYVSAITQFIESLKQQMNARTCCLLAHCLRNIKNTKKSEDIITSYIGDLCLILNKYSIIGRKTHDYAQVPKEYVLAAHFAILAKEMLPCDPDIDSEYILCLKNALDELVSETTQQPIYENNYEEVFRKRLKDFLMDSYGQRELCIEALIALYEYGVEEKFGILEDEFYKRYSGFGPMKRGACAEQLYELFSCEEYKNLSPKAQSEIAIQIYKMQRAINKIKYYQRVRKETTLKGISYVHYTKINVLKGLLSTTAETPVRFRLSNIAYMNDPSEGDSFGALLYSMVTAQKKQESRNLINIEEAKNFLSDFNLLDNHVCEIGFLGDRNVYTTSLSSQRDSIYMWGIYADNGKGCCIQFDEDFFQLRETYPEAFIPYYVENNSYPLYQMCYLEQKSQKRTVVLLKRNDRKIEEDLWQLIYALQSIHKHLKSDKSDVPKAIYGRVMAILDQVRYLFKYQEYEQEQEFRSFIVTKNFKLDETSHTIPRLYTEINKDIRLEEVCLGPNIQNGETIEAWLYATHRVNKVTRSARHYR